MNTDKIKINLFLENQKLYSTRKSNGNEMKVL